MARADLGAAAADRAGPMHAWRAALVRHALQAAADASQAISRDLTEAVASAHAALHAHMCRAADAAAASADEVAAAAAATAAKVLAIPI